MDYFANVQLMLGLFIPLIIGIFLYKTGKIGDKFVKELSMYLYNIALPCSIIKSMRLDISVSELLSSFWLPLICVAVVIFWFFAGRLVVAMIEKKKQNWGIILFALMFPNFIFSAYPILETLYGSEAVFYASIFNIGMFSGTLTIGIYVVKMSSRDAQNTKFQIKDLLSIPFLSLILGIILLFIPIKFPSFIDVSLEMLANTTTPLGILLTGLVIAREGISFMKDISAYVVAGFRLLVIPITTALILKLIGVEGHMLYVPVIILANPAAVNLVMFSENFNAPSDIGANYVVISSALAIVTIPFINLFITI